MLVIHAIWTDATLRLWAEDGEALDSAKASEGSHPFAVDSERLAATLAHAAAGRALAPSTVPLRLPARDGRPAPSTRLAHAKGLGAVDPETPQSPLQLVRFEVPAVSVAPQDVGPMLDALEDHFAEADDYLSDAPRVLLGPTVDFYLTSARLARHLLAQQRFVPAVKQLVSGQLEGLWMPWLSDAWTAERVSVLVTAMPPAARAAVDALDHQPWPVLESFLTTVLDAQVRRTLIAEQMHEAIQERDPAIDPQVAWLSGLLDSAHGVQPSPAGKSELVKSVRRWISTLEERGTSSQWRLLLRLSEPSDAVLMTDMDAADDCVWTLSIHLQSQEAGRVVVDAADIWALASDSMTVEGKRLDAAQELLLKELGRAARLYKRLEEALDESEPEKLELTTKQAYEFLREFKPILIEQNIGVQAPEWWDLPSARLGVRLKLTSESLEAIQAQQASGVVGNTGPKLGLGALVQASWDISLGGTTLSLTEFEKLASKRTPLVRINGMWVEIRPEDVKAAMKFIQENPAGDMRVGDAIRMAFDQEAGGIPIVGLETEGWLNAFFGSGHAVDNQKLPIVTPPTRFHGSLRPYQVRGVSWLAFLEKFGFGPCLADDMGLGKTIQLLALLAYEREQLVPALQPKDGQPATGPVRPIPPTLLVVPMSVVGNWLHETKRFCPELDILVHHGVDRLQGDAFKERAERADAVVTTYALAHRDHDTLAKLHWHRIVLDEAQYIKNANTKQSLAVRALSSTTRVCLTGTPVENRLGELWSILDFLNPGYLGSSGGFRKRFSVPIERYHDSHRGKQLKELVKPFLLRRLKSDPTVAADLPEKLETREFCHLTPEQADLYQTHVKRMLAAVDAAEGIQRRGLVLSTLVKLKQICNHPAQMLKEGVLSPDADDDDAAAGPAKALRVDAARSGKCVRLIEILDEVLAAGEQALVFTQFRQMGELLVPMLRQEFDKEVLFLHGGSTQSARVAMVDKFQKRQAPILCISLKAGGVGLNLTAATHVVHFDRWWNPAVENQATDRAHRIGQHRTVHVHKFVVRGTLEERIDAMIEQKTELAERIIGSGESWLTELSTDQLREMLTLRGDAVGLDV